MELKGGIVEQVNQLQSDGCVKSAAVFNEELELGSYQGPPISLDIDPTISPRFLKCRPIPYAIREKVDLEIQRLVDLGVLEPIPYSKWATPIVTVIKKNGNIRLCGDYKSTVNLALRPDKYPLPLVNEIFSKLAGCKIFSKLDLDQAYMQVKVDSTSAEILTINTPKGLFKVNRLPFGISAAPGIFQRLMENILMNIPGVAVLIDDIIVAGSNQDEHDQRLQLVLNKLSDAGLKTQRSKCKFSVPSVDFLGFQVDAFGIHPTEDKIEAIKRAPEPKNKTELQAFLGLLNFYERFLERKATVLEPLHRLLDKNSKWEWKDIHSKTMQLAKDLLSSDLVLTHFDPKRPLILACDASPYGVGAVLSHQASNNGQESPIAYASRTLSTTERNYSQLDKEALAIMFGIKKFHQYLWGRKFTIFTDHKPLLGILAAHKQTPAVMPPRMLRWSLILGSYDYELVHRPGKQNGNADALSRLPQKIMVPEPPEIGGILLLESYTDIPIHVDTVARETGKDATLQAIKHCLSNGWSEEDKKRFPEFFSLRNELSIYQDCILRGNRVVIPLVLRKRVLSLLHSSHRGIVITKALARSYIWWPGLDHEIELNIKGCTRCQRVAHMPPKVNVEWPVTTEPWSRLHMDFFGPIHGHMFFILVDSYSKWPEVRTMVDVTSGKVIEELRDIMATHGIPHILVSDNGPSFVSKEFEDFLLQNGIQHLTSPPYHPSSNGQAERFVQTVKDLLSKLPEGSLRQKISKLLFSLRTTPNTVTGQTPAELLMGRKLRNELEFLVPQKPNKNIQRLNIPFRVFQIGEKVWIRMYVRGKDKWVRGQVVRTFGRVTYQVKDEAGLLHKRHINQLRRRISQDSGLSSSLSFSEPTIVENSSDVGESESSQTNSNQKLPAASSPPSSPDRSPQTVDGRVARPSRTRRMPGYLKDYVT